jgi:hypothetical protein
MKTNEFLARAAVIAGVFIGLCGSGAFAQCPNAGTLPPAWTTSQFDNSRNGVNRNETCLTAVASSWTSPSLQFTFATPCTYGWYISSPRGSGTNCQTSQESGETGDDSPIYAEPLWYPA